jgi:hypothetical protein
MARHAKNLYFGDAQTHQIMWFMFVKVSHKNCALHADGAKYCPFDLIVQIILSATFSSSST